MTPRIPRGWAQAYERGEGVWYAYPLDTAWDIAHVGSTPLYPTARYIRRVDPDVSADPNECLRLEDEAARLVSERGPLARCSRCGLDYSEFGLDLDLPRDQWQAVNGSLDGLMCANCICRVAAKIPGAVAVRAAIATNLAEREPTHSPDAGEMVPGMMRTTDDDYVLLSIVHWINARGAYDNDGSRVDSGDCAAAYTAAWEYTERRRAEIAEEVRREMETQVVVDNDAVARHLVGLALDNRTRFARENPPQSNHVGDVTKKPDLAEWPGRAEVPPGSARDVKVLTPRGQCVGFHAGDCWRVYIGPDGQACPVDPADVLAWRELPRAAVVNGRVVG